MLHVVLSRFHSVLELERVPTFPFANALGGYVTELSANIIVETTALLRRPCCGLKRIEGMLTAIISDTLFSSPRAGNGTD